jgi:hypothetical protein
MPYQAPFQVARKGERIKIKPKRWTHQQELEGAVGRQIYIAHNDGLSSNGQIAAVDAFTIKIVSPHAAPDQQSAVTIFKSSIKHYRLI